MTDAEAWAKAAAHPHEELPSLILSAEVSKLVVKTRLAMTFETECTCVCQFSEAHASLIQQKGQIMGSFIASQKSEALPQWLNATVAVDADEENGWTAYWNRAMRLALAVSGRLVLQAVDVIADWNH